MLQAGTDRALGAQLRDKAAREAAERARDEQELAAVLAARAAADAKAKEREAKAAAERKALSDAIRKYNECGPCFHCCSGVLHVKSVLQSCSCLRQDGCGAVDGGAAARRRYVRRGAMQCIP